MGIRLIPSDEAVPGIQREGTDFPVRSAWLRAPDYAESAKTSISCKFGSKRSGKGHTGVGRAPY